VEPWIGFGVLAILAVIRHFAARRIGQGHSRSVWLFFGPTIFLLAYPVWIAVRMWTTQPLGAIGLGLFSVATLLLFIRMASQSAHNPGAYTTTGELSGPAFDYIIWMALGAPLVLVVVLLLLLVAGGLRTSQ
jgi:hypothetical protein